MGTYSAWLVSLSDFKYKKILHVCSILPLIYPLYVMSFIYVGLFEYSGPVMTFFRNEWGVNFKNFVDIKSVYSISFIFSLCLHPYVYLLLKQAFIGQGDHLFKVSRSLGHSRFKTFILVTLPMAKPWLFSALAIILMETLADFGGVSVFNFNTFTTAIYESWTGMFSFITATKLSAILIFLAVIVLATEAKFTSKQRFFVKNKESFKSPFQLNTSLTLLAILWLSFLVLTTLIIPFYQLILWCKDHLSISTLIKNSPYLGNTLKLALIAAVITTFVTILLASSSRLLKSKRWDRLTRVTTLGYAIPGSIIAVAVFGLFTNLGAALESYIDQNTFLYFILIIGLMTRFLSISYKNIFSSFKQISPNLDKAAALFVKPREVVLKIYIPLIKPGIISGFLMIFIEVMKEMPMTLMLRPFGQDTLSVKIYEFTSEGDWQRAAVPAVMIVLAGFISITVMTFIQSLGKKNE